jgi:hypothetical protein
VFGPTTGCCWTSICRGKIGRASRDNYARELDASAIQQLTGQAVPTPEPAAAMPNPAQQGRHPAPAPRTTLLPPVSTGPAPQARPLGRNDTSQSPGMNKRAGSTQARRQRDLIKMLRANNPYQLIDGTLQLRFPRHRTRRLTEAGATPGHISPRWGFESGDSAVAKAAVSLQPWLRSVPESQPGLSPDLDPGASGRRRAR